MQANRSSQTKGEPTNVAAASREAFANWVDENPGGRTFGQVSIQRTAGGGYGLRHVEDVGLEGLELHDDPRAAREISKLTERGEHRPLKSAPNLRRGWTLQVADAVALFVAMGYLYPAGVVHWYLYREGKLEVTNYRENAARQSGIYKRVQRLSDEGVRNAARACCEDIVCLKKTLWDVDQGVSLELDRGDGEIPCPEPCSVFVSLARRVRLFEREERRLPPGALTPSEKEDLAALIKAGSGGDVTFAREAEFEEPLNERRLRYRELTLIPKLQADGDEAPS